jgi:hypothetical protein
MKKLVLSVAIATTLFSCSPRDRAIKLPNGSIVRAEVTNDVPYSVGTKVCIRRFANHEWQICNDGEMKDTTISSVTHKVGYVSAYLD